MKCNLCRRMKHPSFSHVQHQQAGWQRTNKEIKTLKNSKSIRLTISLRKEQKRWHVHNLQNVLDKNWKESLTEIVTNDSSLQIARRFNENLLNRIKLATFFICVVQKVCLTRGRTWETSIENIEASIKNLKNSKKNRLYGQNFAKHEQKDTDDLLFKMLSSGKTTF